MNFLDNIHIHRQQVLDLAAQYRADNVRLFGSVLRGEAAHGSDIDMLVDPLPGATLFDLGGLQLELQELLGVPVDLLTPGDLPESWRQSVLSVAVPL
jgi:predicted nucleotidyltransferase